MVYNSGYSEDEICNELENMINGGSWVKFETHKKYGSSQKVKSLKKSEISWKNAILVKFLKNSAKNA